MYRLSLLLFIIQIALINSVLTTLDNPKSIDEFNDIVRITNFEFNDKLSDAEIANQVLARLREASNRKHEIEPGELGHKEWPPRTRGLIDQYLAFADNGHRWSCSANNTSDILFMIDFHSKNMDGSQAVLKYLQHFAFKLFSHCKPIWDKFLNQVVHRNLDAWTRANMRWLVDSWVDFRFGVKSKLAPRRPYKWATLRELVNGPPSGAIVLYLARMGDIWVDDRMKNAAISWADFKEAFGASLMPMCHNVCKTLAEPAKFYNYLFVANLNHRKEAELMMSNMDRDLSEWLATKQICCKIMHSNLRLTYEQLVSESEEWDVADKEVLSLARIDFGFD